MGILPGILIYVVIVALPAWYMNKWMLRITRPSTSFLRFLLYFFLSLVVAILYAAIFVLILTAIYPSLKK